MDRNGGSTVIVGNARKGAALTAPESETINNVISEAVRVRTRSSLRAINRFLALKCSGDLLNTGLYSDARDILSCMALFNSVRKAVGVEALKNPDVRLFVCGGSATTYSTFFRYMTRWKCNATPSWIPNTHLMPDAPAYDHAILISLDPLGTTAGLTGLKGRYRRIDIFEMPLGGVGIPIVPLNPSAIHTYGFVIGRNATVYSYPKAVLVHPAEEPVEVPKVIAVDAGLNVETLREEIDSLRAEIAALKARSLPKTAGGYNPPKQQTFYKTNDRGHV